MKRAFNYFFGILFLFHSRAEAQTVLLQYDKSTEPTYAKGPNQKKFTYGTIHFGFVLPEGKEDIAIGSSVSWGMGLRKKFKVSPLYSLGWEFQFDFTDYKYKNTDNLLSPLQTPIDVRRFDISSISLGIFNRFNFDPGRGDFMGTYFDIGLSGKYCYSMQEVYKYETGYGRAKTEIGNLDYVTKFQSELIARLGFSRLNVWVNYRVTDIFKATAASEELSRMAAGIEIGLY